MAVHILPPRRTQQQPPRDTAEPGRVSVDDMEVLIAAGEAQPLLEEFDVGPTFYQGIWWVVPEGEWDRGFAAASGQDQLEFSRTFLRLERAAEIVAVGQHLDARRASRTAETHRLEIQALQEADVRARTSAAENGRRPTRGEDC